jgi:hypothetical protein
MLQNRLAILGFLLFSLLYNCKAIGNTFVPIEGFDAKTNERLERFFLETKNYDKRKIAVFAERTFKRQK